MNEKRDAYIRVAIAMGAAGSEDLHLTRSHSAYFLRGIIDWAEDGKKANLNMNKAPTTYKYSVKASALKYEKSAYKNRTKGDKEAKLHAEHVIPNIVVFNRFLELIDDEPISALEGAAETELSLFLEQNCEVVVITKAEADVLDSELGLRAKMPDGWKWGYNRYARLYAAGIEIEQ
jgi:hypothetical protein